MSDWQPMDAYKPTAGRRVLIWCPRMETAVVAELMTDMKDGVQTWVYARRPSGNPAYAVAFIVTAPTAWQPLPSPPQGDAP